jgi:hypothetical protein
MKSIPSVWLVIQTQTRSYEISSEQNEYVRTKINTDEGQSRLVSLYLAVMCVWYKMILFPNYFWLISY